VIDNPDLIAKAAKIKLFITDVDGVWTDGHITVYADGSESVNFSVQDGYGITQLIKCGIEIVIISGRNNPAVQHRAERLGVSEVIMGSIEKTPLIETVCRDRQLTIEQVAVIGDDIPDLAMFAASGLRFAPANAMPEVKAAADIVTTAAAGNGALREACDFLRNAQSTSTL